MPTGLTVADNLSRLWRYFSLEYELFRGVIGWVPRVAAYDVKCTLVEHLHEDMRRTRALRERIADFGVFAPERRIDPGMANLVRHLLQAPFDGALAGAFYRVLKTGQAEAYRRHLSVTLRLNDAPTVAVFEDHLPRLDRQIAWAKSLLEGPSLPGPLSRQVDEFEAEIGQHLEALGGLFQAQGRTGGTGATSITGGSSIADLEALLAGDLSGAAQEMAEPVALIEPEAAELAGTAEGDGSGTYQSDEGHQSHQSVRNGQVASARSNGQATSTTGVAGVASAAGVAGVVGAAGNAGNGHLSGTAIPDYPQFARPRLMALEPRFSRLGADRKRDEPWETDILIAAAYTHFTELPVIDICAAIVYDGRDVDGLGADRGGDELGAESGVPDDPEKAQQLLEAREKYARAVKRAQTKRARGEGLNIAVQSAAASSGRSGAASASVPVDEPGSGGQAGQAGQAGQGASSGRIEMPFDFYCDFLRQTWDEVRHSRMGFERLQALGIDPYRVVIPLGHYAVWGNMHLRDRMASLTQVGEACSFTGKREWVAFAHERGEWLSALEHDYDMVDEKNHVRFGARWLPELLKRLGDPRTPEEVVQDADWTFRRRLNAVKRDLGEAWREELGNRFLGCGTQTSDVTLAPEIIA